MDNKNKLNNVTKQDCYDLLNNTIKYLGRVSLFQPL